MAAEADQCDVGKLRGDCLRLGNISPSMWVFITLNDWINRTPSAGQMKAPDPSGTRVQTDFRPDEESPPGPYWGLFAVDERGRATGEIWAIAPGEVLVFGDREEARRVARGLPAPRNIPGSSAKKAEGWAVRGVSTKCLKHLQATCRVRPVPGVLRDEDLLGRIRAPR